MKKILLFSFFILSSIAMTSCTADEMQVPTQNQTADDTGGQHGIPTPPPPPPPPPAMGGGKTM
ncbi:hypothetical protein [Flavobacterium sp. 102]|uniref:hypothetical protein n=1 Tax=Flavobacterium sp. 102 TaxID=2135623 RepID=UPI000F175307|nr:hypothetical protein [Flavobacterium sp. 102]RKS00585.1 hypothetical protein C8C84_0204 [Flavobacterium sp. 102]